VHFHTFSELPVNLPTANSHYLSVTFDNCMTRFTRDFQTFRIHRLFYKHPSMYLLCVHIGTIDGSSLQGFALNLLHLQPNLASIEIAGKCERNCEKSRREANKKRLLKWKQSLKLATLFPTFYGFSPLFFLFFLPPADVTVDPLASRIEFAFKSANQLRCQR